MDLLNSNYGAIKARWERTLTEELSRGAWPDIPPPRAALPAPGQTLATRAQAEAALKKMGAGKLLEPRSRSHREWIDRWEARIALGGHPTKAIAEMLTHARHTTEPEGA
ncbi:hypothetical protein D3C87_1761080 [compost metagenome]